VAQAMTRTRSLLRIQDQKRPQRPGSVRDSIRQIQRPTPQYLIHDHTLQAPIERTSFMKMTVITDERGNIVGSKK
jgi:hypothetical protein